MNLITRAPSRLVRCGIIRLILKPGTQHLKPRRRLPYFCQPVLGRFNGGGGLSVCGSDRLGVRSLYGRRVKGLHRI